MKSNNFNRLAVATAVTGAMAASLPAMADTYTATATVNNAITLTEITPMSFGTFAVVTDGANDATLVLAPAGTISATAATAGTDKLTPLGGHSAAQIDATVAPFTAVTFTIPTAVATTLVHSSGNPALPTFSLAGASFTSSGTAVTADATGTASINVGATLSLAAAAAAGAYQDGTYSGTYDVTVSY